MNNFFQKHIAGIFILSVLASITAAYIYDRISQKHDDKSIPSIPEHIPLASGKRPIINRLGMKFVKIPAGEFLMGSTAEKVSDFEALSKRQISFENETPQHRVRISKPFYLGQYEVTQQQWMAVMGKKPGFKSGGDPKPNEPIYGVTWDMVESFIHILNANEDGAIYRLPTEAEWEYAARAGTTTAYSFGDSSNDLGEYAWYLGNAHMAHRPVGSRKPNSWGLYDMYGSVQEWVQDWYGKYDAQAVTDPQGPVSGNKRVIRGGSVNLVAIQCRSANRFYGDPDNRAEDSSNPYLGFRLVKEID